MKNCDKLLKDTRAKRMLMGLPTNNLNIRISVNKWPDSIEKLDVFRRDMANWNLGMLKSKVISLDEYDRIEIVRSNHRNYSNDIDITVE